MAYSTTSNSPAIGSFAWANVSITFDGVTSAVTNGSTANKFVYWQKAAPTAFLTSNTYPTLGPDDALVFINKGGVPVSVLDSSVVDGGLVVPGTITADAIAANTISAVHINAKAITADKLVISNFSNLAENPNLELGATGWSAFNSGVIGLDATNAQSGSYVLSRTSVANNQVAIATNNNIFSAVAGESYYISGYVKSTADATGTAEWRVEWLNSADVTLSSSFLSWTPSTTYLKKEGIFTVPANAVKGRIGAVSRLQTAGTWYWDSVVVTRGTGAELIVDGAIKATKLDVDSVTAGKIAAGAVSAREIAAEAITAEKLTVTARMGANLVGNPAAEEGVVGWTHAEGTAQTFTTNTANKASGSSCFEITKTATTVNTAYGSLAFPVTPGDTYGIKVKVKAGSVASTTGLYVRLNYAAVEPTSLYVTLANRTGFISILENGPIPVAFTEVSGSVTIPAGAYWASFVIYNWSTSNNNTLFFDECEVYKKNPAGSLIVDGTIDATHIKANSITADRINGRGLEILDESGNTIFSAQKGLVTQGSSITESPNMSDATAWTHGGHGPAVRTTVTDGQVGEIVYRAGTSGGSVESVRGAQVSANRTYRISALVRKSADSNGTFYLRYATKTPLGLVTQQDLLAIEAVTPQTTWTRYTTTFSPAPGQNLIAPRAILNWPSGSTGYMEVQDLKIEEFIEAAYDRAFYNEGGQNILSTKSWGTATVPGTLAGYNKNQNDATENSISYNTGPDGAWRTVWRGYSADASATSPDTIGPDGGWNTTTFTINPANRYRFTVWIKCFGTMDGSYYLGCQANSVREPSSTASAANANPYFVTGARAALVPGRWYLLVGYVHPSTYADTTFTETGIYDSVNLTKVAGGQDWAWVSTATTSIHRAYQFYSTLGAYQDFVWPRVEIVNGSEPTLNQLMTVAPPNRITSANVETHVGPGAIGNTQIGTLISSTNFNGTVNASGGITSEGTTGWAISKGGRMVVNDLYARGNIAATSLSAATGTFTGELVAASGSFSGTLSAGTLDISKLVGTTTTYGVGNFTVTVPSDGKTSLRVALVGAGGGGTTNGGGGGGGLSIATYNNLTPGATYSLSVAAPTSPNVAGGASTFTGPGISLVANGGGRGINGGAAAGGTGTTSSGSDSLVVYVTIAYAGDPKNGSGAYSYTYAYYNGGNAGGNSAKGGAGYHGDTLTTGSPGGSPGGGGGGSDGASPAYADNIPKGGGSGRAIIEFFNPNGVIIRTEWNSLISALQRQGLQTA